MNNNHDNHYSALKEELDFTVEETGMKAGAEKTAEEIKDALEEKSSPPPRKWKLFILPLLLLICLLLTLSGGRKKQSDPAETPDRGASEETVSVTEAEKDDPDEKTSTKETQENGENKETAMETEKKDLIQAQDYSWQDVIFGDYEANVVFYPISILGLTENEKNLTSFRESDFVRSLSSFLSMNNIRTSAVTFSGSIACSAPHSAAYRAQMKGVAGRTLIVVFFPKYPGKYLFALEDEKEEKTETKTERESAPQSQMLSLPQTQQQAVVMPQTENAYDAMSLTLSGISSELGNYLSNPYELQYGLYDYLYNKGIRNAKSAEVTSYYIDSTDRSASIQIEIKGVGNVTAIYDPEKNEYTYQ